MAARRRTTARGVTRIKKTLAALGMGEDDLAYHSELIASVGWLEDRLYNARLDLGDAPLTVEYDNGGGQRGVRKNPAFDAFLDAYRQYMQGIRGLLARLPEPVSAGEGVAQPDVAETMARLRDGELRRRSAS